MHLSLWSHDPHFLYCLCLHRVGFTGSLSLTPSALVLASSSSPSSCALASPSSMVVHLTPLTFTWKSSNTSVLQSSRTCDVKQVVKEKESLIYCAVKATSNPVSVLQLHWHWTVFNCYSIYLPFSCFYNTLDTLSVVPSCHDNVLLVPNMHLFMNFSIRSKPVLSRHHWYDLPLPSLVQQSAALLQSMLGFLHSVSSSGEWIHLY